MYVLYVSTYVDVFYAYSYVYVWQVYTCVYVLPSHPSAPFMLSLFSQV